MGDGMAEDDHDDTESTEPDVFTEDAAGDPAAAFEALRATVDNFAADLAREMTTIRKGVEAAFDQIERQGTPVDYSADLGRIVQRVNTMGAQLQAIEQSPLLRQGAEHYARALERSGEGLVRAAVQQLERQAAELERTGRQLAAHTKSAHDRKRQDLRLWLAVGGGLVAGAFLLLLLPRFLPFSTDTQVASLVIGSDRVSAGQMMIQAGDPAQSQDMATAGWVYATNRATLDKCIAEMFQTKQAQRCALTLPVVESRSGP
jgi:hypothetical protein